MNRNKHIEPPKENTYKDIIQYEPWANIFNQILKQNYKFGNNAKHIKINQTFINLYHTRKTNNLQLISKIKYTQETQLSIRKKSSVCINRNIRFNLT